MKTETVIVEVSISKVHWAWIIFKAILKVVYFFIKEKVLRIKP